MDIDTDFGSRVEDARRAKGLTQWELAQRIGASQAYISLVECGYTGGSNRVRAALLKELGLSKEEPDIYLADGLHALSSDQSLVEALGITDEEWRALQSIELPAKVDKFGYVRLLTAIRAII